MTAQTGARTRTSTVHDRRLEALAQAALQFRDQVPTIEAWGRRLAHVLRSGGRLLACGNGGSAAEAQHLTAELVGRFGASGARCRRSRCTATPPRSPRSATTTARSTCSSGS